MRSTLRWFSPLLILTLLPLTSIATAVAPFQPPTPAITTVEKRQLPLGFFTTTITGTGFYKDSVASLNGVPLTTTFENGTLTVSGFYSHPGTANLTVSNDGVVSAAVPVQIGVLNPKASPAAARRFLEQAAFGPSPTDADHVQTVGIPAWLDEQFNLPQVSMYESSNKTKVRMPTRFLTNAVNNPDQLRQRVAFTLSQIFVASLDKLTFDTNMVPFQNMLLADSFSNYRKIMEDVTLSDAMGEYLDMANNGKGDPSKNIVANENYARELMQLFTIGSEMLNQDGTPQLDKDGLPIPTYSQFTITEFARVYTGWTYQPSPGRPPKWPAGRYNTSGPMIAYKSEHDFGAKKLLNGYVSPAGVSPEKDLDNALDNIFNHPNVGPFVGKQLIRHLVKSNPSPAYVSRVAAAFNDNGHGVRGDMRAVIQAVLLDPEARLNDEGGKEQAGDGHLQEPALFIAGMIRALDGKMNDQNTYRNELAGLGQSLFDSPSVFNYYSPDYMLPGTTVTGGEFQINTPNNAIVRANLVARLIIDQQSKPVQTYGPGTSVDFSPFIPLASNPASLIDALDLTFTHGVMPAKMKAQLIKAVKADTGNNLHKVQTGTYLILTSNFYNVWH